jgi:hypothetical protein
LQSLTFPAYFYQLGLTDTQAQLVTSDDSGIVVFDLLTQETYVTFPDDDLPLADQS